MGYVVLIYYKEDKRVFIGYSCRMDHKNRTRNELIKRSQIPERKGHNSRVAEWVRECNFDIDYKILDDTATDADIKFNYIKQYEDDGYIILNSDKRPKKKTKETREEFIQKYIESRKPFYNPI